MKNNELLLELIKIDSESENEVKIADYICGILLQKGFKVKKQLVNKKVGTYNIFAYIGKPKVIFSNHIDTVPGQIEIKISNDKIFGRGACDNKSQVAAAILAGERALKSNLTDFGLLFTVQEEKDLLGAKYASRLIPNTCKLVVVGEPTNLDIVTAHNGILVFELISKGKTAHGSVPKKGINAIELLIDDLNKLRKAKFKEDSILGKNILNIGKISGGIADNIVPDYAKALITYRTVKETSIFLKEIKKKVNSNINILMSFEPFFNNSVNNLAKVINVKTKTVKYFTEASVLGQKSAVIIIGAGNINQAHSQNEFVSIKQYNKLVDIYLNIINHYN